MGFFSNKNERMQSAQMPDLDEVAKWSPTLALMMDPSISLREKRIRLNEQLAKEGLPQYNTDEEMFYDIVKGNRSDAEFEKDIAAAQEYLRRAEPQ
ncbi:MAG: hypothetical protein LBL23_09135 [Coriobacteriales bacterium]|jgi:hypothetical protein|nr:hypothetical protein [Coriobacteriales bacterium]